MDEEDRRTLFCGNLAPKITDELLFELFLQAGPVEKVSIPKDKDGKLRTYGFVTFKHEASVPYAIQVMDGTALHGRQLAMKNRRVTEQQQQQRQQQPHFQQQQQRYSDRRPMVSQQSALATLPLSTTFNPQSVLALQGLMYQQAVQQASMLPQQQERGSYHQQDYYQQGGRQHQQRSSHHQQHDRGDAYQDRSSSSHRSRQQEQQPRRDDKPYARRHRR